MTDLIVVTGPPGAGKSSVARVLADGFVSSALVPGDDFFGLISRGLIEPWTPEARQQNEIVIDAAAAAAGRLAAGGYVVVYDGVVAPWSLETFLMSTGLGSLHYVVLLPPQEHCLARVLARAGHGFTDLEATRAMHRQFADAQVGPRHVMTDLSDDSATTAASIRDLATSGSLLVHRGQHVL